MKFDESIVWMVLFWIISVIVLILLLTRIFGHSATDMQIYLGFFGGLLIIMKYIGNLGYKTGQNEEAIKRIDVAMREGFQKVREDISEIKNQLKRRGGK